ncbi:hypothetical protein HY990_03415 [Candidatus Micrarchaeota archaeon]|nr:hypothetical protein [Candidatus Micrarchaeota archaeon]
MSFLATKPELYQFVSRVRETKCLFRGTARYNPQLDLSTLGSGSGVLVSPLDRLSFFRLASFGNPTTIAYALRLKRKLPEDVFSHLLTCLDFYFRTGAIPDAWRFFFSGASLSPDQQRRFDSLFSDDYLSPTLAPSALAIVNETCRVAEFCDTIYSPYDLVRALLNYQFKPFNHLIVSGSYLAALDRHVEVLGNWPGSDDPSCFSFTSQSLALLESAVLAGVISLDRSLLESLISIFEPHVWANARSAFSNVHLIPPPFFEERVETYLSPGLHYRDAVISNSF